MRHIDKNVLLLCVAVVMVVALLSLKEAKAENTLNVREFVMIEGFTPIEIRMNSTIAQNGKIITTKGAIYPEFYDLIHPSLTEEDEVVDGDVSEQRIVLMLAKQDKSKYLRIATWEWENRKYTIVDSKCLPQNSFLEKYHDGDSVLLDVGYITEGDDEPEELDDLTWLYFTIELNMQGEWSITNITDGYTFFADYDGERFIIRNYEDEKIMRTISMENRLSSFYFETAFWKKP